MDLRLPICDFRGKNGRACPGVVRLRSGVRARGFTMVEILTVLGIIAILAGIIAVAFSVIGNNASTRQTRLALETLKAMTAEYSGTTTTTGAPWDTGWNSSTGTGYAVTGRVMQRLMKMPKNVEAFGKLEAKLIDKMPWSDDGAIYAVGDLVDGYVCNTAHTSSSSSPNRLTDGKWDASSERTYALKDGWGKHILYCGSGLSAVTRAGVTNQTVTSPDSRPFWVSAGPDGDFQTHDDNVYSFEN